MKKIYFFCFALLLSGCTIQYDGSNRLLVSGKIIDKNGNPISNIEVITNVSNGSGWGNSNDDIGIDLTDSQGNFMMFFPKPKRDDLQYSIQFQGYDGIYQEKRFMNVLYEDFSNLEYNLDVIKLYKQEEIINLELYFASENYSKQIADIHLIGEISNNEVWVNLPNEDNYYYPQNFYQVVKNQVITVEYSVYNSSNNQTTYHTESIEIGEEDLSYTINY